MRRKNVYGNIRQFYFLTSDTLDMRKLKGLSNKEVEQQLKVHGYNELPSSKPKSIWRIAVEVIKEPMFILLLSCGSLYLLLGDYVEGIILLASIIIIIFISFYQHHKTEKSLDALRRLSSPRALVIREGKEVRIAGREVVPEDILIINEGDRVAADALLIACSGITIDESLLTGESVPVMKAVNADEKTEETHVYSGTLVVQGRGLAKVLATGEQTKIGKIGTSLQMIVQDQTRLQKEMKVLIRTFFIIGISISLGVIIALYLTRGNFIQSLLSGLASAMAILPEEFPVVMTIFLALGAWRLSNKNILTRKQSAIETLGSTTVLCSDKTGTITQNKMEVAGLSVNGELISKKNFAEKREELLPLIRSGLKASQEDAVDPMEKAIGVSFHELGNEAINFEAFIKEYPLTKDFFAMSKVYKNKDNGHFDIHCKGAPELVISLCKQMTDSERKEALDLVHEMAALGMRVIGVANAKWEGLDLPEHQTDFDFEFVGLLGFEDPIRPEVPQAVKECNDAGIRVIMITGDYPETAKCIYEQIGLSADCGVISGSDISKMKEEELREKIKSVSVFARIQPEQKLKIVMALKANNEVVTMTGDGVNDAPALKAADIGVAMGNKGTDVAREASSMVLLDDNFASIVLAIRLGRKIYDNLQKAMTYILAIHIPIIGLALLPVFFPSLPILLMPLHIVFMELIIDPICSIAFESEQEEKGIMNHPPRDPDERFFGPKKMIFSLIEGLLLLLVVVTVYFLTINEGHSEGEVRAIAFASLILGNVFLILTSLSKTRYMWSVFFEKNTAVLVILGTALLMLFLIIYIPVLQETFSLEFPGFYHFLPAVIGAFAMVFILEMVKFIRNFRSPAIPKIA